MQVLREALSGTSGVVLLGGDLSYADGFGPRWDSFARLVEPLASTVPVMTTGGNHEVSDHGSHSARTPHCMGALFSLRCVPCVCYRYPMPHAQSGSVSNLYPHWGSTRD